MASAYKPLIPRPPANVVPIEPTTGQWTKDWAAWLAALEAIVRELQSKE
jgi:hypothetical protein